LCVDHFSPRSQECQGSIGGVTPAGSMGADGPVAPVPGGSCRVLPLGAPRSEEIRAVHSALSSEGGARACMSPAPCVIPKGWGQARYCWARVNERRIRGRVRRGSHTVGRPSVREPRRNLGCEDQWLIRNRYPRLSRAPATAANFQNIRLPRRLRRVGRRSLTFGSPTPTSGHFSPGIVRRSP